MRKLLLITLLLGLLVFAFSACRPEPEEPAPTPPVGPPASPAPPEVDPDAPDPWEVLGLTVPENYVVIRATINPSANIAWARWGNEAVNANLRDLMWGFRSTMERNMQDEWFPNPAVMVGGQMPTITDDAEGNRTYTFTIYTTNLFSDGRPITAWDYGGSIAFHSSPYWAAVPGPSIAANAAEVVGVTEWRLGEVPYFSGVRVYNDSTFSVTIGAEYLPFSWEQQMYMNWSPWPLHAMGMEARDEGNGVFLVATGGGTLTNEDVLIAVNGGGYVPGETLATAVGDGFRFNPTVFVGPYMFHSVEVPTHLQGQRNPNFGYTWDGYTPRIEYVMWRNVPNPLLVDSLAAGEVHITVGQGTGSIINSALEVLVRENQTHNFLAYNRHGFGQILFHCDHGPTQFTAVRQAIKWLIDRDEFGEMFTEGHGAVAHGPYSTAWWWHNEAVARGMHDRMIMYTLNPSEANRILDADGWIYAEDGVSPWAGPGTIRHKWVDEWDWLRDEDGALVEDINTADGEYRLRHLRVYTGEQVLMPLVIEWATWADPNPITDVINVLMPGPLMDAGIYLNETRMSAPTGAYMSPGRNSASGDRYNMFNLGAGFGAIWTPWFSHDMAYGSTWVWPQIDDPRLVEYANRMRFLDLNTEAGRNAMVEAYMDFMVYLNYLVIQIPLYIDIFYDFVPTWLGNWDMNSIWGVTNGIVRAYIRN